MNITPEEAQALQPAMMLLQAGQLNQAEQLLERLAEMYPQQAEVAHLQAVTAMQMAQPELARAFFNQALQLNPQAAHIYNNFGNFLQAQNLKVEALEQYEQALKYDPYHLEALVNSGALLMDSKARHAQKHLETVLKLQPGHPQANYLRGMLAYHQKDILQAIHYLTRSFQLRFEPFQCAYLMAELACQEQGYVQALNLIQEALKHPEPPVEYVNLQGLIYFHLGQHAQAQLSWEQALSMTPNSIDIQMNLAAVEFAQGRYHNAETLLLKCLNQTQDLSLRADLLENLANVKRSLLDVTTAQKYIQEAVDIRPRTGLIYSKAFLLPGVYQNHTEIEQWRQTLIDNMKSLESSTTNLSDPHSEVAETLFLLAYQGLDDKKILSDLADIYLRACPELAWIAPHCEAKPKAKSKLKIGFVSSFFKQHTVAKLMRGLIAHFPREDFEVLVCAFTPPVDAMATWISQHADTWMVLPPVLSEARQAIAAEEFDVLLYSDTGMESLTYFLAFARLAPVQATTWGHGISSGIPNMDIFLSSKALESEQAQSHYREHLVLQDHLFPYYFKPERQSDSVKELNLPSGNLYGCLQTLMKIHPNLDPIFFEILKQDPDAKIILLGDLDSAGVQLLKQRFHKHLGELAERIVFHPLVSEAAYLELCAACKVHLDPLSFGGGNTSYEALSVGAPIVTMPGEMLKNRITYALYQMMDYHELTVETSEEYIALALRLGTQPEYRDAVSQVILSKVDLLFERREGLDEMAQLLKTACLSRVN